MHKPRSSENFRALRGPRAASRTRRARARARAACFTRREVSVGQKREFNGLTRRMRTEKTSAFRNRRRSWNYVVFSMAGINGLTFSSDNYLGDSIFIISLNNSNNVYYCNCKAHLIAFYLENRESIGLDETQLLGTLQARRFLCKSIKLKSAGNMQTQKED